MASVPPWFKTWAWLQEKRKKKSIPHLLVLTLMSSIITRRLHKQRRNVCTGKREKRVGWGILGLSFSCTNTIFGSYWKYCLLKISLKHFLIKPSEQTKARFSENNSIIPQYYVFFKPRRYKWFAKQKENYCECNLWSFPTGPKVWWWKSNSNY